MNRSGWNHLARVIMEEQLGRALSSNEYVHHIDGDFANDNISNLKIMTNGEHMREHRLSDGIRPSHFEPHTQETKDKISRALIGRMNPHVGRLKSQEERDRISETLIRRWKEKREVI